MDKGIAEELFGRFLLVLAIDAVAGKNAIEENNVLRMLEPLKVSDFFGQIYGEISKRYANNFVNFKTTKKMDKLDKSNKGSHGADNDGTEKEVDDDNEKKTGKKKETDDYRQNWVPVHENAAEFSKWEEGLGLG